MLINVKVCSMVVFRNEHRVMRESLPRVSPQVCSVALLRLSRSQRVGRRGSNTSAAPRQSTTTRYYLAVYIVGRMF